MLDGAVFAGAVGAVFDGVMVEDDVGAAGREGGVKTGMVCVPGAIIGTVRVAFATMGAAAGRVIG